MECVHSDLKQLEVVGILTLEEGGPSGAIQPVVPFDRIEVQIDYPLVDHSDADDVPASAYVITILSSGAQDRLARLFHAVW